MSSVGRCDQRRCAFVPVDENTFKASSESSDLIRDFENDLLRLSLPELPPRHTFTSRPRLVSLADSRRFFSQAERVDIDRRWLCAASFGDEVLLDTELQK